MNVPRHHYMPTETQRAEVKAAAQLLKQRIERRRREREAFAQFQRIGFGEVASGELAAIHADLEVAP